MVGEAGPSLHMSGVARLAGLQPVRSSHSSETNLALFTAWWAQGYWISYLVAGFSVNRCSGRQEVEAAHL